jgi:hypothetical protein
MTNLSAQDRQLITVTGHAIRGENETQLDATKRAINDAKWQAVRQAGEFVQVEQILLEYNIREDQRSEYISSINVISPAVLREISHEIVKTYDHEKEAERYQITVKYEFDRQEIEKRFRSFLSTNRKQEIEVLNDLIKQYSSRLNMLDSLLALGETETARYISLLTEVSGIYRIIKSDVEIQGNEISQIIEKQNQIYLELIDLYFERLDYLLKNKFYLDLPVIDNRSFVDGFNVKDKKKYNVKYEIEWSWDNQYKVEISEIKNKLETQIPIQYSPYLEYKTKRLNRKHRGLKIELLPAGSNRLNFSLKDPYYRVFLDLKRENGRRFHRMLLHYDKSFENVERQPGSSYSTDIVLNRNHNRKLKYMSIKHKTAYLFSNRVGFKLDVKYDYIASDSTSGIIMQQNDNPFSYYGFSFATFLNLKLSKHNTSLSATRLRVGVAGNLLSYGELQNYNDKLFFTLQPLVAIEYAKIRKRSFRGVGFSYSPKFANQLGRTAFANNEETTYEYTNESQLYLIFGHTHVGFTYHVSNSENLKGYGVVVGFVF